MTGPVRILEEIDEPWPEEAPPDRLPGHAVTVRGDRYPDPDPDPATTPTATPPSPPSS